MASKTEAPEYACAMDKLRDEMARSKGRYVHVVGEFLTDYLLSHPEAEKAILKKDKTIEGSLKAMREEASKHKEGNVAVLDDATAFGVVLKYFGVKGTGMAGEGTGTTAATPTPEPDPFDLDALMGVM